MSFKFEVGKKYKNQNTYIIAECVYKDEHISVLKASHGSIAFYYDSIGSWEEHKEPVVHKRWVHFYKNGSGIVQSFSSVYESVDIKDISTSWVCPINSYLGCVPIEFKEEM